LLNRPSMKWVFWGGLQSSPGENPELSKKATFWHQPLVAVI
jgi:hypothetical protein